MVVDHRASASSRRSNSLDPKVEGCARTML
jgi:hypothetical protein